ncbi:MAG: alpha/beta hydrolase [Pseudomonadales bacterium]|nr:alpha/beta hydrolase [Pseudomonadales bacterium]
MTIKNVSDFAYIADFTTGVIHGLKYKKVVVNAERVDYLEAGQGEPIVFIHGFGGVNVQWRYWLSHFKRNYRVIAVTIPDLTPSLQFNKGHYSFRNYAQWLDQFLGTLAIDRCHLVSHCTGSCIAAFYASLDTKKVASLTMLSTPEIRQSNGSDIINTFDRTELVNNVDAMLLRSVLAKSFARPPRMPQLILNRIAARLSANREKVNFLLSELSRSSAILLKRLPLIEAPTLIVGGDRDAYLSNLDAFEFYREQIPNSQLVILPECGHFPLYEQQERCIDHVEKLIARNLKSETLPTSVA